MMKRLLLNTLCLICFTGVLSAAPWSDLRVTWGPPQLNPFAKPNHNLPQPRQVKEIDMTAYEYVDSSCGANGTCNGPFCGTRYQLKGDPAVRLVYDPNGYIIGIQTSVPKNRWNTPTKARTIALSDGNYWTLTAYFVDPTTACQGRSSSDFYNFGTGHGMWIPQANKPLSHALHIPDTVAAMDVQPGGPWFVKGKCFWTMGLHYWWNTTPDLPCADFLPIFILYNNDKLDSFGWAIPSGSSPLDSPRYEHPTYSVTPSFINGVPTCMETDPAFANLNTMHIFFNNKYHLC